MNDVEKDRNRKCANLKGIMKIRVKCDSPFLRFEKLTKAPEVSEEETQHLLGILVR